MVKHLLANAGDKTSESHPRDREIHWRRKWQPTPVFLRGESHGQRSRAGYSPWGRRESDTTEHTHICFLSSAVGMLLVVTQFFLSGIAAS